MKFVLSVNIMFQSRKKKHVRGRFHQHNIYAVLPCIYTKTTFLTEYAN